MIKRYTFLFTVLLLIFSGTAAANPWVVDTTIHWSVSEVCQDGFLAYAYDNRSGILQSFGTPQVDQRNLQAHLLNDNFLTTYPTAQFEHDLLNEFGSFYSVNDVDLNTHAVGELGETLVLDVVNRPNPLFVDFSSGELATWYDVDALNWGQSVAVGKLVAIQSGDSSRVFVSRVADCNLPQVDEIRRMSIDSNGVEGNGKSSEPSLSANGNRITFSSIATNLVGNINDTNGSSDIFIHSQRTDVTQLISMAGSLSVPAVANGASYEPDMSYDGARVVFTSLAGDVAVGNACDNLDDNGVPDVYRWDWDDSPPHARLSLFSYHINGNFQFCLPLDAGTHRPRISNQDVTMSTATILHTVTQGAITDNNGQDDVLMNMQGDGETVVISAQKLPSGEISTGNGLSDYADIAVRNQWVAFQTDATDLVPTDANGVTDVVLMDSTGLTTRAGNGELISVNSDGEQADGPSQHPAISGTAEHIAFDSVATNLHPDLLEGSYQVYVRDRVWDCTILLSQSIGGDAGNGDSTFATISADGRYVAFTSTANNLVPDDNNGFADIFVVDRDADGDGVFILDRFCTLDTWSIRRVSNGFREMESNGDSTEPDFAANGAWLSFTSTASNLVDNDTNDVADVFVVFNGYDVGSVPLSVGVRGVSAEHTPFPLLITLLVVLTTTGVIIRTKLKMQRHSP